MKQAPLLAVLRRYSSSGALLPAAGSGSHILRPTPSQQHRLQLFESEHIRQRTFVKDRVTKMFVRYCGLPEDVTVMMNGGLSTPLDCAAHVQELLCKRSVVALVDGQLWDMNKPIDSPEETDKELKLELLHFKSDDPQDANLVFWRSCSFLLGAIVESAFKENVSVQLCSFPSPNIQSGSFVYDMRLLAADGSSLSWSPRSDELRILSMVAQRMALEARPFEPLTIDTSLALEMFSDSPIKAAQIPAMAKKWHGPGNPRITVYKVGHHVDICRGPLMSHTGLVGRFSVTAAHRIETPTYGPLFRFQGVALPPDFLSHFTTFDILRRRATKLNPARVPTLSYEDTPRLPPSE